MSVPYYNVCFFHMIINNKPMNRIVKSSTYVGSTVSSSSIFSWAGLFVVTGWKLLFCLLLPSLVDVRDSNERKSGSRRSVWSNTQTPTQLSGLDCPVYRRCVCLWLDTVGDAPFIAGVFVCDWTIRHAWLAFTPAFALVALGTPPEWRTGSPLSCRRSPSAIRDIKDSAGQAR